MSTKEMKKLLIKAEKAMKENSEEKVAAVLKKADEVIKETNQFIADKKSVEVSHGNKIRETEKAECFEFFTNKGVFKIWLPKKADKRELLIQSKIEKILSYPKAEIVERTENAVKIVCFNLQQWIPTCIFETEFRITPAVEEFILKTKYTADFEISQETDKAVNIEGHWVPKRYLVKRFGQFFVPKWMIE